MKLKTILISYALACFAALPVITQASNIQLASSEKKYYKTIGPDGEVIYTDKPVKDGKEIDVPKGSTYEPPATPQFESRQTEKKREPFEYESLVISKPAHKETIWSNLGEMQINISLQPSLRMTHNINILVDGSGLRRGKDTSYSLSGINPGEHELTVQVVDPNGKVLKSQSSIFYMKRHTVKR